MKIIHHFNYVVTKGVENNEPSQTVPGQVQTISSMLQRIQGGIMPPNSQLEYPDIETDEQIRFRDLTDIDTTKSQIAQYQANAEKRAAQKEADAKAERERSERENAKKADDKQPENA